MWDSFYLYAALFTYAIYGCPSLTSMPLQSIRRLETSTAEINIIILNCGGSSARPVDTGFDLSTNGQTSNFEANKLTLDNNCIIRQSDLVSFES